MRFSLPGDASGGSKRKRAESLAACKGLSLGRLWANNAAAGYDIECRDDSHSLKVVQIIDNRIVGVAVISAIS